MNNFYVYAYLRKDKTPYYFGKGSGGRAYQSMKNHRPPKDRSKIVIVENNLTEFGAFAIERRMIRWYGRKDIKTGILHNKTDGGDGRTNIVITETTRKRLSRAAQKRPPMAESTKKRLAAIAQNRPPQSEERRRNQSIFMQGNNFRSGCKDSEETKKKKSNCSKNKPLVGCIFCKKIVHTPALAQWHGSKCKEKKNV
jgi:hypothetical protein